MCQATRLTFPCVFLQVKESQVAKKAVDLISPMFSGGSSPRSNPGAAAAAGGSVTSARSNQPSARTSECEKKQKTEEAAPPAAIAAAAGGSTSGHGGGFKKTFTKIFLAGSWSNEGGSSSPQQPGSPLIAAFRSMIPKSSHSTSSSASGPSGEQLSLCRLGLSCIW